MEAGRAAAGGVGVLLLVALWAAGRVVDLAAPELGVAERNAPVDRAEAGQEPTGHLPASGPVTSALVEVWYGGFLRAADLGPQERLRLRELLADRLDRFTSLARELAPPGRRVPLPPREQQRVIDALDGEFETAIRELLGDELTQAYREYRATLLERRWLEEMDHEFAAAGAALEPEQARALLARLREERRPVTLAEMQRPRFPPDVELAGRHPGPVRNFAPDPRRLAPLLTPAQREIMDRLPRARHAQSLAVE